MTFNYALVTSDGQYYTGKSGAEWVSDKKRDAFTYTEQGAHTKIKSAPFTNFEVVRVI